MSQDYRYEVKFVLNEIQLSEFEFWMAAQTSMKEAYPDRVVNSLYFDDSDYRAARDNLTGLPNREKFRFRWYGNPADGRVLDLRLERKVREGRLGFKQSCRLQTLEEKLLVVKLADLCDECREEFFRIGLLRGDLLSQLIPTLYVSYNRQYYQDINNVRITVDRGIEFSEVRANAKLLQSRPILYSKKIVEIKFSPDLKDNVAHLMKSLHIAPKRCSKYLHGLSMIGTAVYI